MKTKFQSIPALVLTAVLALTGPLSQTARSSFILTGDQQLTVNSFYNSGTLYDTSRVFIVGGFLIDLTAYDSSVVNISGGSVGGVFYAYNSSAVDISSGSVNVLFARDSTTVDISGGSVQALLAYSSSSVNISGGQMGGEIYAFESSKVDISGGSLTYLKAYESSVLTFHGQNFFAGAGLAIYEDRVLGTGTLSGQWMDGTPWSLNILEHHPTATILAIPEPATLLLLGLGAVMVKRKRH